MHEKFPYDAACGKGVRSSAKLLTGVNARFASKIAAAELTLSE